jgi:cyclic-di-GMP phosphodiesterase TipF (flagellum assembly factor)
MACATAAVLLEMTRLTSPVTCILFGIVLLMLAGQLHASVLRRREKRRMRNEIAGLKRIGQGFSLALEDTHAKIETVKATIEANATAQSRKIVAELQMLEGLMREFAAEDHEKAKEVRRPGRYSARTPRPRHRAHLSRHAGRIRPARNHPRLARGKPRRSLSAADREPAAAQAALLRGAVAPARGRRLRDHAGAIHESGGPRRPDVGGRQSAAVPLRADRAPLIQKSREIGVFCNISGDTLADAEFFPQFLEYMHHNRDLAHQIVFEFGQDAVLKAGAAGRGESALSREPRLRAVDGSRRNAGAGFRKPEDARLPLHEGARRYADERHDGRQRDRSPRKTSRSCSSATA